MQTQTFVRDVKILPYDQKVLFFFGDTPRGNQWSTLRLIRNDIQNMADAYPNAKGRALIFPRAMCLMTAVDLLAKMYDGKDEDKRAGDRFKDFIKFALPTEIYGEDIGATIYEFRNALHHSYQMPVPKSNGKGMQRFFSLIYEVDNHKVSTDLGSKILINFPALHKACEVGFESFKKRLETTNLLSTRQGFEEMFSKYGWMSIG